jgi:hypothetical protein
MLSHADYSFLASRFSEDQTLDLSLNLKFIGDIQKYFDTTPFSWEPLVPFDGFLKDDVFIRDMSGATSLQVVCVGPVNTNTMLRAFWFAYSGVHASCDNVMSLRLYIASQMFVNWSDASFRALLAPMLMGKSFDLKRLLMLISDPATELWPFGVDILLWEVVATAFQCEIRLISVNPSLKACVTVLGARDPRFRQHLHICWNGLEQSPRYFAFSGSQTNQLVAFNLQVPVSPSGGVPTRG